MLSSLLQVFKLLPKMVAWWCRSLIQALPRSLRLNRKSGESSDDDNRTPHRGDTSDVEAHSPSQNNTNRNLDQRVINIPQHPHIENITIITIGQEHASRITINGVLCDHNV